MIYIALAVIIIACIVFLLIIFNRAMTLDNLVLVELKDMVGGDTIITMTRNGIQAQYRGRCTIFKDTTTGHWADYHTTHQILAWITMKEWEQHEKR